MLLSWTDEINLNTENMYTVQMKKGAAAAALTRKYSKITTNVTFNSDAT